MRNKLLIVLIGATMLTGCHPKGILTAKQMENIFVDLHTTEAILQEAGYNYGHDEAERAFYLVLLEEHGTTQAQFDSSLVWYTAHPTMFDKIYPKVVERLQAQSDMYIAWMDTHPEGKQRPLEEWLKIGRSGLDKGSWQDKEEEKDEKSAQKFVYVEKKV